jgi:hypothetical protein
MSAFTAPSLFSPPIATFTKPFRATSESAFSMHVEVSLPVQFAASVLPSAIESPAVANDRAMLSTLARVARFTPEGGAPALAQPIAANKKSDAADFIQLCAYSRYFQAAS